jgi:hypothetical protein
MKIEDLQGSLEAHELRIVASKLKHSRKVVEVIDSTT